MSSQGQLQITQNDLNNHVQFKNAFLQNFVNNSCRTKVSNHEGFDTSHSLSNQNYHLPNSTASNVMEFNSSGQNVSSVFDSNSVPVGPSSSGQLSNSSGVTIGKESPPEGGAGSCASSCKDSPASQADSGVFSIQSHSPSCRFSGPSSAPSLTNPSSCSPHPKGVSSSGESPPFDKDSYSEISNTVLSGGQQPAKSAVMSSASGHTMSSSISNVKSMSNSNSSPYSSVVSDYVNCNSTSATSSSNNFTVGCSGGNGQSTEISKQNRVPSSCSQTRESNESSASFQGNYGLQHQSSRPSQQSGGSVQQYLPHLGAGSGGNIQPFNNNNMQNMNPSFQQQVSQGGGGGGPSPSFGNSHNSIGSNRTTNVSQNYYTGGGGVNNYGNSNVQSSQQMGGKIGVVDNFRTNQRVEGARPSPLNGVSSVRSGPQPPPSNHGSEQRHPYSSSSFPSYNISQYSQNQQPQTIGGAGSNASMSAYNRFTSASQMGAGMQQPASSRFNPNNNIPMQNRIPASGSAPGGLMSPMNSYGGPNMGYNMNQGGPSTNPPQFRSGEVLPPTDSNGTLGPGGQEKTKKRGRPRKNISGGPSHQVGPDGVAAPKVAKRTYVRKRKDKDNSVGVKSSTSSQSSSSMGGMGSEMPLNPSMMMGSGGGGLRGIHPGPSHSDGNPINHPRIGTLYNSNTAIQQQSSAGPSHQSMNHHSAGLNESMGGRFNNTPFMNRFDPGTNTNNLNMAGCSGKSTQLQSGSSMSYPAANSYMRDGVLASAGNEKTVPFGFANARNVMSPVTYPNLMSTTNDSIMSKDHLQFSNNFTSNASSSSILPPQQKSNFQPNISSSVAAMNAGRYPNHQVHQHNHSIPPTSNAVTNVPLNSNVPFSPPTSKNLPSSSSNMPYNEPSARLGHGHVPGLHESNRNPTESFGGGQGRQPHHSMSSSSIPPNSSSSSGLKPQTTRADGSSAGQFQGRVEGMVPRPPYPSTYRNDESCAGSPHQRSLQTVPNNTTSHPLVNRPSNQKHQSSQSQKKSTSNYDMFNGDSSSRQATSGSTTSVDPKRRESQNTSSSSSLAPSSSEATSYCSEVKLNAETGKIKLKIKKAPKPVTDSVCKSGNVSMSDSSSDNVVPRSQSTALDKVSVSQTNCERKQRMTDSVNNVNNEYKTEEQFKPVSTTSMSNFAPSNDGSRLQHQQALMANNNQHGARLHHQGQPSQKVSPPSISPSFAPHRPPQQYTAASSQSPAYSSSSSQMISSPMMHPPHSPMMGGSQAGYSSTTTVGGNLQGGATMLRSPCPSSTSNMVTSPHGMMNPHSPSPLHQHHPSMIQQPSPSPHSPHPHGIIPPTNPHSPLMMSSQSPRNCPSGNGGGGGMIIPHSPHSPHLAASPHPHGAPGMAIYPSPHRSPHPVHHQGMQQQMQHPAHSPQMAMNPGRSPHPQMGIPSSPHQTPFMMSPHPTGPSVSPMGGNVPHSAMDRPLNGQPLSAGSLYSSNQYKQPQQQEQNLGGPPINSPSSQCPHTSTPHHMMMGGIGRFPNNNGNMNPSSSTNYSSMAATSQRMGGPPYQNNGAPGVGFPVRSPGMFSGPPNSFGSLPFQNNGNQSSPFVSSFQQQRNVSYPNNGMNSGFGMVNVQQNNAFSQPTQSSSPNQFPSGGSLEPSRMQMPSFVSNTSNSNSSNFHKPMPGVGMMSSVASPSSPFYSSPNYSPKPNNSPLPPTSSNQPVKPLQFTNGPPSQYTVTEVAKNTPVVFSDGGNARVMSNQLDEMMKKEEENGHLLPSGSNQSELDHVQVRNNEGNSVDESNSTKFESSSLREMNPEEHKAAEMSIIKKEIEEFEQVPKSNTIEKESIIEQFTTFEAKNEILEPSVPKEDELPVVEDVIKDEDDPLKKDIPERVFEAHWDKLPQNVIRKILELGVQREGSSIPFLVRASLVNKAFNEASKDLSLWTHLDLSPGRFHEKYRNDKKLEVFLKRFTHVQEIKLTGWKTSVSIVTLKILANICPNLISLGLAACYKLTADDMKFIGENFLKLQRLDLTNVSNSMCSSRSAVSSSCLSDYISTVSKRLLYLNLSNNKMSGLPFVFKALATHCTNLAELDISNITTTTRDAIYISIEKLQKGCPKLQILNANHTMIDLSDTPIKEQIHAPGFPLLRELHIAVDSRGYFEGLDDQKIERILKASDKLRVIDIRGCQNVTDSCLVRLPSWDVERLVLAGSSAATSSIDGLELMVRKWDSRLVEIDVSTNASEKAVNLMLYELSDSTSPSLRKLNLCSTSVGVKPLFRMLKQRHTVDYINLTSCRGIPKGMGKLYSSRVEVEQLRDELVLEMAKTSTVGKKK